MDRDLLGSHTEVHCLELSDRLHEILLRLKVVLEFKMPNAALLTR